MSYRESYAKNKAVQMYFLNQTQEAVEAMLQQEGAGEQASKLAESYYQDFVFIRKEQIKRVHKTASMSLLIGIVCLIASVSYAFFTYFILDSGNYIVLGGLLITGLIYTAKGWLDRRIT